MKQLNADALIIGTIALSWLCGVVVTFVTITAYSAIRRYEKRQKEVPGEITDPFEGIDLTVRSSEQPYVC